MTLGCSYQSPPIEFLVKQGIHLQKCLNSPDTYQFAEISLTLTKIINFAMKI